MRQSAPAYNDRFAGDDPASNRMITENGMEITIRLRKEYVTEWLRRKIVWRCGSAAEN